MAIAPGVFAAHNVIRLIVFYAYSTVPDPDLEIRRGGGGGGGGGGHPDPSIRVRDSLQQNFFGPSRLSLV